MGIYIARKGCILVLVLFEDLVFFKGLILVVFIKYYKWNDIKKICLGR